MEYIANKIPSIQVLCEWLGASLGLVGAYFLATHGQYADWGFVFFLTSNLFFILFAIKGKHYGLLIMQLGFTYTSLLGIYNGFDIPYNVLAIL